MGQDWLNTLKLLKYNQIFLQTLSKLLTKNPTCFHKSDFIYFLKSIFFILKTTSELLHRKHPLQLP